MERSNIDRSERDVPRRGAPGGAHQTPIDYQDPSHGSVRQGRLWAYRDPVARTCYFDWRAGRGAKCLLEMLGYDEATNIIAYEGAIHTDGYTVYDTVAAKYGIRHGGCLAHVRRKFTDLGPASPEVTLPIFHFIQRIYQIEKQTRHPDPRPHRRRMSLGMTPFKVKPKIRWLLVGGLMLLLILGASKFLKTMDFERNSTLGRQTHLDIPVAENSTEIKSISSDSSSAVEFTAAHLTPILFYGKVIDQNGAPIHDLKVRRACARFKTQ